MSEHPPEGDRAAEQELDSDDLEVSPDAARNVIGGRTRQQEQYMKRSEEERMKISET
jgi:hypothetical protein